jgi:Fe-S-cluster containining protein
MARWTEQGKIDVIRAMEHRRPMWAGDIIVSQEDGKAFYACPFLRDEGEYYSCTIYDDRPSVCRNYAPGSSEICPQFRKS